MARSKKRWRAEKAIGTLRKNCGPPSSSSNFFETDGGCLRIVPASLDKCKSMVKRSFNWKTPHIRSVMKHFHGISLLLLLYEVILKKERTHSKLKVKVQPRS